MDWDNFESDLESAFEDINKDIHLCQCLQSLHWTNSVYQYTKIFLMLQEVFGQSSSPGLHGRGARQDVIVPIV